MYMLLSHEKKCVLVVQSCLTFCDPMDHSPPGPFVHETGQIPWGIFQSLGDLPNAGIEPGSPTLLADSLLSELPGKPGYILHQKFQMEQRFKYKKIK